MNRTEHTNPRGANGPTHICDSFFGKPARLFFCLNRQVRMSYDSSILGLDCSRFMIHESGSMFGFARVGNQINHSLLYATASAIRSSTHPRR